MATPARAASAAAEAPTGWAAPGVRASPEAWASRVLRRQSASLWLALRLLCPSRGFRIFALVYAYFRWADDRVDAPGRDPEATRAFAARQRALLGGARPPEALPEQALTAALADPEYGPRLAPAVEGMGRALAFDAARDVRPLPDAELEAQIARVGDAYVTALWVCAGGPGAAPDAAHRLARAATRVHVLRDLAEDRALGYLNTPPEVEAGGAPARAGWIRGQADRADLDLTEGSRALAAVRPLRARWLLRLYAAKYARVLARLPPPTA